MSFQHTHHHLTRPARTPPLLRILRGVRNIAYHPTHTLCDHLVFQAELSHHTLQLLAHTQFHKRQHVVLVTPGKTTDGLEDPLCGQQTQDVKSLDEFVDQNLQNELLGEFVLADGTIFRGHGVQGEDAIAQRAAGPDDNVVAGYVGAQGLGEQVDTAAGDDSGYDAYNSNSNVS